MTRLVSRYLRATSMCMSSKSCSPIIEGNTECTNRNSFERQAFPIDAQIPYVPRFFFCFQVPPCWLQALFFFSMKPHKTGRNTLKRQQTSWDTAAISDFGESTSAVSSKKSPNTRRNFHGLLKLIPYPMTSRILQRPYFRVRRIFLSYRT